MTAEEVYRAYEERSWRALAQRARLKGGAFVVGRREGAYVWDLDGERRLLDCALSGGLHSLGHRAPEILAALRGALDSGLDGGLWLFPTPELLSFQDALAAAAPAPALDRSVVTLSSTASIDLAVHFASRVTGRSKILAYRQGYHGHAGFAAMVTGSREEGIFEYYGLPNVVARFFERYGDLEEMSALVTPDVAAVVLEPFNYETWEPAPADFLPALQALCSERGALLIVDETRTGLGRSGKFWMCEHWGLVPDILITGKGLAGGLYPASALLTTTAIYDRCINEHQYGFASSMGGNEISCVVGQKVVEICRRPEFYEGIRSLETRFRLRFGDLCERYPGVFAPGVLLGGIVTIGLVDASLGPAAAQFLFEHGVLCHSVSVVAPARVKFFPILTGAPDIADEVADALERFARR
ncbi:MAG: aminotransferase class III-fold pyridoxal phosphate-dependent enzyme [Terrimicrobiaceae bacterium]|nr:aminotransferase class III-fold pyridoxal phosphate-dependent enzyme [Terrimicrobiaceae bacterium]